MDQTTGASMASAGRRLGAALRRHRDLAGLTQQALARRVGYSRSTIANAEAGDVRAGEFYRRCDAALGAGGALASAYLALEPAVPRLLGGPGSLRRPGASGGRPEPLAAVPPEEAIEHLRRQWHLLVRTDNLLGPVVALPLALGGLSALATLLSGAADPVRSALLSLSARYAEVAAAIHEDAGEPAHAAQWASRALEWGHEAADRRAVAWALYRRSQLYAAEGDADRALSAGRAALREGGCRPTPGDAPHTSGPGRPAVGETGFLTRSMVAAFHVQQACGHALAGAPQPCGQELRRAMTLAAEWESAGDATAGQGSFCTRPWVAAQRGRCALLLGAPASAVASLRAALAGLAPVYHRDRGLVLGWLAEACARTGADGEAQRLAQQSLAIGAATGSLRVVTQARAAFELAKVAS